jgi:hypothetical protein
MRFRPVRKGDPGGGLRAADEAAEFENDGPRRAVWPQASKPD